jgi:hypothetical protein
MICGLERRSLPSPLPTVIGLRAWLVRGIPAWLPAVAVKDSRVTAVTTAAPAKSMLTALSPARKQTATAVITIGAS